MREDSDGDVLLVYFCPEVHQLRRETSELFQQTAYFLQAEPCVQHVTCPSAYGLVFTRFTRRGFQQLRSATASLLVKSNYMI